MEAVKTTTKDVKYLGKKCKLTTIYFTKSKEGKRLIIRKFEDGIGDDIKLVEGFAGRYEKKYLSKHLTTKKHRISIKLLNMHRE